MVSLTDTVVGVVGVVLLCVDDVEVCTVGLDIFLVDTFHGCEAAKYYDNIHGLSFCGGTVTMKIYNLSTCAAAIISQIWE